MPDLKQSVEILKAKRDSGRQRADAAEARTADLQKLNEEKKLKLEELEERLRLTRQAAMTLRYLVPVLQKLHTTETKLSQRLVQADAAEAKYDTLQQRIEELEGKYDTTRKENKELHEMVAELGI